MWIDTHCHLDAHEFNGASLEVAGRAKAEGVSMIVIPAVEVGNFDEVSRLAGAAPNASYALGIHPICVPNAREEDLSLLRTRVEAALADPRFVAIGEIGLDFFIPILCEPAMREKQAHFFREQLRIARDFELPVLMHVRRSQDQVLKHVRQVRPAGGIAHAFNGSFQQAQMYIDLGFRLGFGGAMTFTRALQIRGLDPPGAQQPRIPARHRRGAGRYARCQCRRDRGGHVRERVRGPSAPARPGLIGQLLTYCNTLRPEA
jgi:TatD DNase family protein